MIGLEAYAARLQAAFPWLVAADIKAVEAGWVFFVLDAALPAVPGRYIFRFARRTDGIEQLQKEICLLPVLAPRLSLPVPCYEFIPPGELQFAGYRKIPGEPLTTKALHQPDVARQLGRFLSELHTFPPTEAAALGLPFASSRRWQEKYRAFYLGLQETVLPLLTPSTRRYWITAWEQHLDDEACFDFQPTLIHADLAAEHILYDPAAGTVGGVIDWGDAALGDPALDFAGLVALGGWQAVEAVLASYTPPPGPAFRRRVEFYIAIAPFYEVLFGLEAGGSADPTAQFTAQGLSRLESQGS